MKTETLEIYGIFLTIFFYFEKGMPSADEFSPDDPDELEIEEIKVEGVDIKDIISRTVLDEIKCQLHNILA